LLINFAVLNFPKLEFGKEEGGTGVWERGEGNWSLGKRRWELEFRKEEMEISQ
jgi:hypothetical protein